MRHLGSHGEVPHLLTVRLQAEDGAASLLQSWYSVEHAASRVPGGEWRRVRSTSPQ